MNKLTAKIGSVAIISNCDLTAWIIAGWSLIGSVNSGHVEVRKVKP